MEDINEWYQDANYVKHNIEHYDNLLHITYEDLTVNIESVIDKILNFIPELESLDKNVSYTTGISDSNRNKKISNFNIEPRNKTETNYILNINKNILKIMDYFNYAYME